MSIVKKVGIDGKEVLFKASAAIPRIYRLKFQRDIYKDLRILEKSIGEGDEEHSNLDLFSLEMFENFAYIMARHADRYGLVLIDNLAFFCYSKWQEKADKTKRF